MKKNLYKSTSRKGKEKFFFVARIVGNDACLMLESDEAQYFRIVESLQNYVDTGAFDEVFTRGRVFAERVERVNKQELDKFRRFEIIEKIRRNFRAITWDELQQITQKGATLEDFLVDDIRVNEENDYIEIEKILPLKQMTKEEYVSNALSNRFPDFHKKLLKEHKMLGVEMEIL